MLAAKIDQQAAPAYDWRIRSKRKAQDFFLALCHNWQQSISEDPSQPRVLIRRRNASELTHENRRQVQDMWTRVAEHLDSITFADLGEGTCALAGSYYDIKTGKSSCWIQLANWHAVRIAQAERDCRDRPHDPQCFARLKNVLKFLAVTIAHELVHVATFVQGVGNQISLNPDSEYSSRDRIAFSFVEPYFEDDQCNELGEAFEHVLLGGEPQLYTGLLAGCQQITLAHRPLPDRTLAEKARIAGQYVRQTAITPVTEAVSICDDESIAKLFTDEYWKAGGEAEKDGCGMIKLELTACGVKAPHKDLKIHKFPK